MTFWTCSSVAVCSITMTMGSPLLIGPLRPLPPLSLAVGGAVSAGGNSTALHTQALQAPALIDDPLEDPAHRQSVEGPRVLAHQSIQDPGLPLRGIDGEA